MPNYSLVSMSDYKRLFIGAFSTPVTEIIWRSWTDNSHINNANGVDVGSYPYASINHMWNCGESPTQELVDAFEMTNGALPVTYDDATRTRVTVTPEAAEDGRRWRFHPYQTITEQEDGSVIVSFRASGMMELAWHLFTWRDTIEIIAPERLKQVMVEELQTSLARHQRPITS